MAVAFLHGVETIEVEKGPRPINQVRTAVVGLIGSAPTGPVNQPIVIRNTREAAQFGSQLPGFTIPQALDAIFDHGAGAVIVINVLDPATDKASIVGEVFQFNAANGIAQLSKGAVANVVIKSADGNATYTVGDDYTVDALSGELRAVSGGDITLGTNLQADFDHADPTAIAASDIIGEVNGTTGNRSGIQALEDTYNLFGYFAKILIAPGFSTQNSVASELAVMAAKLRAMALIDAPIGTTPNDAITGRGPSGAINFNTSSDRVVLCYPHLKVYDVATDTERLEPYSSRLAGVICRTDVENGYWHSPSNKELAGIVGAERSISARINDPNTEANALNEKGIVTVFNSFGTGLRTWGNRSAAHPSVTHPKNFISVRRTADVIHESIEYSMLQFIDQPINNALIDAVLQSVNGFLRTLISRNAIIDGELTYDPAKNIPTEIAKGKLLFDLCFMPPVPGERLTFESFIDINKLAALAAAS